MMDFVVLIEWDDQLDGACSETFYIFGVDTWEELGGLVDDKMEEIQWHSNYVIFDVKKVTIKPYDSE